MILWHDDPTLDELIGDPLTQAIMNADRVDRQKLEAMLRSLAREIADRSGATTIGLRAADGGHLDRQAVRALRPPVGASRDASACGTAERPSQHCGAP
jgi:hypothetical protein